MSFEPDWISPPGHTLARLIRLGRLEADELETALGGGCLTELLAGRREIDGVLAGTLVELVGGTRSFWLTRELHYRTSIAMAESAPSVQNAETKWLRELPIADMRALGWIVQTGSRRETVEACLRFFGVGSVPEWRSRYAKPLGVAAFRTSESFPQSPGAVATWLRAATMARSEVIREWSKSALYAKLAEIRILTRSKDPGVFLPKLSAILSSCGVALAIAPAPRGCRASGASYFVDETPIIALSLRHRSDDHLWFTVFHEIGHLLLHDKEMIYIDDDTSCCSAEEQEADIFARDNLVPLNWRQAIRSLRGVRPIVRAARDIGVSPVILVGFMQHEGIIPFKHLNGLKVRYKWKNGAPTLSP